MIHDTNGSVPEDGAVCTVNDRCLEPYAQRDGNPRGLVDVMIARLQESALSHEREVHPATDIHADLRIR